MIARSCLVLLALFVPGPATAEPLAIESQGSFFIGGHAIKSDTLSTLPAYAPSGTITIGQMYVHYQIPVGASHTPVTLIHGCCLTGKTWETTPDGRMGWDEYFVRQGFPTYVIDQVSRGRSAIDPAPINAAKLGKIPVDKMPAVFSAGHEAAWAIFRFGPEYPQVFPRWHEIPRSVHRTNSGSRWWGRLGARSRHIPIPPCRRCRNSRSSSRVRS